MKCTFTEPFLLYVVPLFKQMNCAVVVQLRDYSGYQRQHEQSQEPEERDSDEHTHKVTIG